MFLLKATCLDPRFKKLKVLASKDARAYVFDHIKEEAIELKAKAMRKETVEAATKEVSGETGGIVKKRKLGLLFEESSDEEEDDDDRDQDILREVSFLVFLACI